MSQNKQVSTADIFILPCTSSVKWTTSQVHHSWNYLIDASILFHQFVHFQHISKPCFFAGSIFLLLFKSFVLFEASFNPKKSRLIDCYLRICRWKHAHWKIDHWEKFSRLFVFLLSTKDIHVTFHFTSTSIFRFTHKQTHTKNG